MDPIDTIVETRTNFGRQTNSSNSVSSAQTLVAAMPALEITENIAFARLLLNFTGDSANPP